jgi:quercetin dioxygenase-like cupin family protein
MRRVLVLAFGAALLAVATASATPGVGLTRTVLAQVTVDPFHVQSEDVKMHEKNRADIVVQQVMVAVGGHTGWHTHFGPAFILVKSGSFALTRADGCETRVFHAGEGFVEGPNDVHIGRNAGTTPVEIIATYTNVPIGGGVAQSVDAPPACD